MRDAGIIGFVPRGEYSDTETYDFLQFVYYGDSTYVAKKETTGNPPDDNNEFWQLLAKGKVFGVSGVKGDKETDYRTGDVNITAANVGALPITGGTVSGNNYYPLYVKNIGGTGKNSGVGIGFANNDGNLVNIQAVQKDDEGNAVLRIFNFRKSPFMCFLELSDSSKKVHDPKTNTLKEIIVEGDAASLLKLLRVNSDVNYKPGINVFDVKEFTNNSENVPTANYYHIMTMQGQDVREEYVTQLAIGMTVDAMYYRRMDHNVWGEWRKLLLDGDAASSDDILNRRYKTYFTPEQLGYTWDNFTYMNVPLYTMICFTIVISNISKAFNNNLIPVETAGVIFAVNAVSRGYVLYFNDNNDMYYQMTSKMDDAASYRPWRKVTKDLDLVFQPGEIFSIPTNTPLAGILTTSAKEIYFTIPLPKSAAGRTVNVACAGLRVRGNAGYIIENKDISEYKVTVTVIENLLKVLIANPSGEAFYDTNNIAVTVAGAFEISFS